MFFYANKCVIWSRRSFMFSQPKIADPDLQIEQRLLEIQIPLARLRSYTASWTSATQQLLSSLNALRVISSFATIKTNCSSTFMLTCKRVQDAKILNDTKWYTYEYMVGSGGPSCVQWYSVEYPNFLTNFFYTYSTYTCLYKKIKIQRSKYLYRQIGPILTRFPLPPMAQWGWAAHFHFRRPKITLPPPSSRLALAHSFPQFPELTNPTSDWRRATADGGHGQWRTTGVGRAAQRTAHRQAGRGATVWIPRHKILRPPLMVGMIMEFGTQNIPLSSQSITSFESQAERKNIHFGGAQNYKNSQGQRGLTASGLSPFTKCS
jgi:hypothetical protein